MVGKDLIMATLLGSGGGSSGSGGGEGEKSLLDAMIDGSITEISNNTAESVGPYAFYYKRSLVSVSLTSAKSVYDNAFYSSTVQVVNLPSVESVAANGFSSATKMKSLKLPRAITLGRSAFSSCTALEEISLPSVTTIERECFYNCTALKRSVFPKLGIVPIYLHRGCSKLELADFPVATSVLSSAFDGCYRLTAVVLRSETVATLGSTNAFYNCYHMLGTTSTSYNPDGLHDGYVYVPRSLIEEYPAATNWSALTLQYRALEDYTVDGTITGDIDPTKI